MSHLQLFKPAPAPSGTGVVATPEAPDEYEDKLFTIRPTIGTRGLRTKKLDVVSYVIDKHLRAGIPAVLAAPGGVGKTWFGLCLGLGLASSLANDALLQLPISEPAGCLYLSAEDDELELSHRLQAIVSLLPPEADEEIEARFHARPLAGDGVHLGSPGWVNAIIEAAREVPDLKLIVLDTLSTLTAGIEENDNTELAVVVQTMQSIAKRVALGRPEAPPVTVLLMHHPKGDAQGKALTISASNPLMAEVMSPRGASVIKCNARWVGWMCEMSPIDAATYGIDESERGDYVAFGRGKGNGGRKPSILWFKRNENGVLLAAPEIGASNTLAAGRVQKSKASTSRTKKEASNGFEPV